MENKCKDCWHYGECYVSDGKDTIKPFCRKIRGKMFFNDGFLEYQEELPLKKNQKACQFFEEQNHILW